VTAKALGAWKVELPRSISMIRGLGPAFHAQQPWSMFRLLSARKKKRQLDLMEFADVRTNLERLEHAVRRRTRRKAHATWFLLPDVRFSERDTAPLPRVP
jgi:hypothetical protein